MLGLIKVIDIVIVNIMSQKKLYFLFISLSFILSACSGETVKFQAGDIEGDFCGVHLNYQYCKCAFDGNFCEQIVMSKSEAKEYVNTEYAKWLEKEILNFASQCKIDNGIYNDGECEYCGDKKIALDGECEKIKDEENDRKIDNKKLLTDGQCIDNSDCKAICDGNIMWEKTCKIETNICEKTFDMDCSANMETFGDLSFSMICKNGECCRDKETIKIQRSDLKIEKSEYLDKLKTLNTRRDELTALISDLNDNCLNKSVDMEIVSMIQFASRVASSTVNSSVEYLNESLDKLYAYVDGEIGDNEKLKIDEYIKLNCDLYDYFQVELASSDEEFDRVSSDVERVEKMLDSLPVL